MRITDILHVSLLVKDLEIALAFYSDVLGLQVSKERPNLGYPGAWLQMGDRQVHLLQLPNPDPLLDRPQHGGRDRHVALSVDSLEELKARLDDAGVTFTASKSGRRALFCRDPDANALEFIEND